MPTNRLSKLLFIYLTSIFLYFFTSQLFAATTEASKASNLTDLTKPILVNRNQPQFDINLASNPTTGYSWFIQAYNYQVLQLISHQYIAPNTKLVGAGGYETWHFKVKSKAFIAPQLATIKLVYIRPWEGVADAKATIITVIIS